MNLEFSIRNVSGSLKFKGYSVNSLLKFYKSDFIQLGFKKFIIFKWKG